MNKEIAKAKATALRTYLGSLGFKINHSHALEAVARMEGETCYNTLQAKFADTPRMAPDKTVRATSYIDEAGLAQEYAALARACLESQGKLEATAESAAELSLAKVERSDGPLREDLDPEAGMMPAYRKGRLVVSLSYSSTLSRKHLLARLDALDRNGEAVSGVFCVCTCLSTESFLDVRRQFVRSVAETLGAEEFEGLSVQELRPGLAAFSDGSHADNLALGRLRKWAAEKSSPYGNWSIQVCRKEIADTTVIVRNATRLEAENYAIGEASSRSLDAHEVDYVLAADEMDADDPETEVKLGKNGEAGQHDWEVTVRCISYGFIVIAVNNAETEEQAKLFALDEANEQEFFNTSKRHLIKTLKQL